MAPRDTAREQVPSQPSNRINNININSSSTAAARAPNSPAALDERRRTSNSFKTMTTGSLVSNSIFTQAAAGAPNNNNNISSKSAAVPVAKRLGSLYTTGNRVPVSSAALHSGSPAAGVLQRKTSGGNTSRRVSQEETVKENTSPRDTKPTMPLDSSAVPAVSKPLAVGSPKSNTRSPGSFNMDTTSSSPLRTTRAPSTAPLGSPRRTSSSFATVAASDFVSSSPFKNTTSPSLRFAAPPSPAAAPASLHSSSKPSAMGLGRPTGPLRAAPLTPPRVVRQGSGQYGTSPLDASPHTPRDSTRDDEDEGDDTETEGESETLDALRKRRGYSPAASPSTAIFAVPGSPSGHLASSKKVTWATTEEVLEFDIEEDQRRRVSNTSSTNSGSTMSERSYDYSDDGQDDGSGAGHETFEEEGSMEVHDLSTDDEGSEQDAEYSYEVESDAEDGLGVDEDNVSTVSTVEEMMDYVDGFTSEDVFSPSLIGDNLGEEDLDGYGAQPIRTERNTFGYDYDLGAQFGPRDTSTRPSSMIVHPTAAASIFSTSTSAYLEDYHRDPAAPAAADPGHSFSYDDTVAQILINELNGLALSPTSPPFPTPTTFSNLALASGPQQRSVSTSTLTAPTSSSLAVSSPHRTSEFVSTSEYAIPDLPENSPFLGFASSPNPAADIATRPLNLTPRSSRCGIPDAPASPTKASPARFIPTALTYPYTVPEDQLSRQASLIESETSGFSIGSLRGSIRGSSKLSAGRERLDERIKRHELLLDADRNRAGRLDLNLFLAADEVTQERAQFKSSTNLPLNDYRSLSQKPRAIQARPPLNATSSVDSSSTSSSIITSSGSTPGAGRPAGGLLKSESALDRLEKGVRAQAALASSTSQKVFEESAVPSGKRVPKRRSLSTSDLQEVDAAVATPEPAPTLAKSILDSAHKANDEFSFGMESSMNKIFKAKGAYQIRETVYADDGQVSTHKLAGDVDPGRAWRKKRPSDAFGLTKTSSANRKVAKVEGGKVFVTIYKADITGLPIPQQSTTVTCELSSGSARVQAGNFKLGSTMSIKREFELTHTSTLEFTIELKLPVTAEMNTHLIPAVTAPPPSPSKMSSIRNLRLFSSPKKAKAVYKTVAAPVPDPILAYLAPDSSLARIRVVFAKEALQCKGKTSILTIPFNTAINTPGSGSPFDQRNCLAGGTMTIKLFYLPAIPGVDRNIMPRSVEECRVGLELAEIAAREQCTGVLTQLGGDCLTWRRRIMKVQGHRLIPYSEITHKAFVEIDLSLATRLDDLNAPTVTTVAGSKRFSTYDDSEPWRMDRSFKLTFQDGTDISFFADDDVAKARWMKVLLDLIGREGSVNPPMWAVALRKSALAPGSK